MFWHFSMTVLVIIVGTGLLVNQLVNNKKTDLNSK